MLYDLTDTFRVLISWLTSQRQIATYDDALERFTASEVSIPVVLAPFSPITPIRDPNFALTQTADLGTLFVADGETGHSKREIEGCDIMAA
jgi:hypothetical protein